MISSVTNSPFNSVSEARYSLREMLQEVELERTHSDLAREFVDQDEITKRFSRRKKSLGNTSTTEG